MDTNIVRVIDEDFELEEKIRPADTGYKDLEFEAESTKKGLLKLSLSIVYFLALVYFLFQLLA